MTEETLPDFRTPDLRDFRRNLQGATRDTEKFGDAFARAMSRSVVKGTTLKQTIRSLAMELSSSALKASIKPLSGLFGNALSNLMSGIGGAAGGQPAFPAIGNITPFAKGGVISAPTFFPMSGGAGLMGEAGGEAILPLARDASGVLGVKSSGGQQSVSVVFNVTSPDAASFRRSETEISAMLARSVQRGRRGL